MSKKKGLSADEKKIRLLELFYQKKEFFQLKELEKIAPKEKGIVAQSVKEVLQCLVDDGLVDSDKIGTSIYFWAFKSKAQNVRKFKIQQLQESIAESDTKIAHLQTELANEQSKQDDVEDTSVFLKELEDLTIRHAAMTSELKKYSYADPEILNILRHEIELAKEANNFWVENIFTLRSWCIGKFGMREDAFNQQFNISEDLDYIN